MRLAECVDMDRSGGTLARALASLVHPTSLARASRPRRMSCGLAVAVVDPGMGSANGLARRVRLRADARALCAVDARGCSRARGSHCYADLAQSGAACGLGRRSAGGVVRRRGRSRHVDPLADGAHPGACQRRTRVGRVDAGPRCAADDCGVRFCRGVRVWASVVPAARVEWVPRRGQVVMAWQNGYVPVRSGRRGASPCAEVHRDDRR